LRSLLLTAVSNVLTNSGAYLQDEHVVLEEPSTGSSVPSFMKEFREKRVSAL